MTAIRLGRLSTLACGLLPAAVVTIAWFVSRWDDLAGPPLSFLDALSDLPALLGMSGFVVLMALGTRFPWIERLFGLDRMFRFHKGLARWVVGLFVAHGLLRTLFFSLDHGHSWTWSYLFYFGTGDWGLLVGHLAFYLIFAAAGFALLGQRRGFPFRIWKSGHLLIYLVVILGFVHAVKKGWDDIVTFPTNGVFAVLAGAALALLFYRGIYRLRRDRRFTWRVERLEPETHDTTSLVTARRDDPGPFAGRRAGQFSVIRIKQRRGWGEPHPFTISCEPEAPALRFTIKAVGRFSAAVPSLMPSTPVLCEGPYGIFYPDFAREKRLIMIAGGVGVTPFLSHLRHAGLTAPDIQATLIWANKTKHDIIAGDELHALTGRMALKIVHVLSRNPDGLPEGTDRVVYEQGHIDVEILRRHIDEPAASFFYLCGPSGMQQAVLGHLHAAFGIPRGQVKRELFHF